METLDKFLDQFVVKEIDFLDYVKAISVANVLAFGKSYQAKLRFVHNTFAERDLRNSNGTLYVKKFAVKRHLSKEKKVAVLEAENKRLEERIASLNSRMCNDCRRAVDDSRFRDNCIDDI